LIAGTFESFVYRAYSPDTAYATPESIARAVITQFAIILFGVAAIKAWQRAGGGWKGFLAALPANIATVIGACIAFWMMREAAIAFAHPAMLGTAQAQPLILPNGWSLDGHGIDPTLVAAIPFFQVGLNLLAPIITADHTPETETDRAARHRREEMEQQHKVKMAEYRGQRWGTLVKSGIEAAKKPEDVPAEEEEEEEPTPEKISIVGGKLQMFPPDEVNVEKAVQITKKKKPTIRAKCNDGSLTARKEKGSWLISYESLKAAYPSECQAYERRITRQTQNKGDRASPSTPMDDAV
jgi:hypothetical protein